MNPMKCSSCHRTMQLAFDSLMSSKPTSGKVYVSSQDALAVMVIADKKRHFHWLHRR